MAVLRGEPPVFKESAFSGQSHPPEEKKNIQGFWGQFIRWKGVLVVFQAMFDLVPPRDAIYIYSTLVLLR